MQSSKEGMFITWRIFQRRSESLAKYFNLEAKYYYCSWEDRSKLHKALSYVYKTAGTLIDLIKFKPRTVFIQLPPTPVLYIIAVYCRLTGYKYVADCHNAMIYSKWLNWPFAKTLLRKADALLVHNEDVEAHAKNKNLNAITLRDPLPDLSNVDNADLLTQHELKPGTYVIAPWSFADDEPISELIEAAESMPHRKFVMTWFAEKLPLNVRNSLPSNLVLTGYLDDGAFNAIFSQAGVALVLTTREGTQPSAASEAIVLGIPLVVSDLVTTRKLYEDTPIYIENTAEGIRTGTEKAFREREDCISKTRTFIGKYRSSLDDEIAEVKGLLGLTL